MYLTAMRISKPLCVLAVTLTVLMVPVSAATQTAASVGIPIVNAPLAQTTPTIPRQRTNIVGSAEGPYTPAPPSAPAGADLVWIDSSGKDFSEYASSLELELRGFFNQPGNPAVYSVLASAARPSLFPNPNGGPDVTGAPTIVISFWTPGSYIPECVADKIFKVDDVYVFKEGTYAYFGGAGFYTTCGKDSGGATRVLLAANSKDALNKLIKEYASSTNLRSPKEVHYAATGDKLTAFFVVLGNEQTGREWVAAYGGDPGMAIYNGYGLGPQWGLFVRPGGEGKIVIIGKADDYLSGAYNGTLADLLFDWVLNMSGNAIAKTNMYGCQGATDQNPQGQNIPAGIPVVINGGKVMAGEHSCSGRSTDATAKKLGNYGVYYEKSRVLIAGLSADAVTYMIKNKKAPPGKEIPSCQGFSCTSGSGCICAGGMTGSGGLDMDKDGYYASAADEERAKAAKLPVNHPGQYDCDDYPYDDINVDGYLCPNNDYTLGLFSKDPQKWCTQDENNNGVGDYAACAACRNPGMAEACDGIDNDCKGHCQASPSTSCSVSGYSGDGMNGGGCESLPANKWGFQDHFCQMADDNVDAGAGKGNVGTASSQCGGYNRCVKWGYMEDAPEDLNYYYGLAGTATYEKYKTYSWIPGGIGGADARFAIQQVIKPKGAQQSVERPLAAFLSETKTSLADYELDYFKPNPVSARIPMLTKTFFSFEPVAEASSKQRETAGLPSAYIDSPKGEGDFDDFYSGMGQKIIEKGSDSKFKWAWQTACVPKDKCKDGADNDGKEDLFLTVPYAYYLLQLEDITSLDDGKSVPVTNHFMMKLADVDDPDCKFKQDYSALPGFPAPPELPSDEMYLGDPVTKATYCLDKDRDAFCGRVSKDVTTSSTQWVAGGSGTNLVSGDVLVQTTNRVYDEEAGSRYVMPKQLMDCDDSPATSYMANGVSLIASQKYGWAGQLDGKPFSSWNVHPFSPVNKDTCTLMYYDFNCNKGQEAGYGYSVLKSGDTPFDWDLSTGKEFTYSGGSNPVLSASRSQDRACYVQSKTERVIQYVLMGVGITLLVVGLGAAVLGAVGVISTATAGTILTGVSVIGFTLTAADATICLGALAKYGKDVSWDSVKQNCYGAALTLGLSGAGYVVGRVLKGSVAVSKSGGIGIAEKNLDDFLKPNARTRLSGLADDVPAGVRPGCFLAGTQIMLANGSYSNIEDIREGDMVMAYDLGNSSAVAAPVTATFVRNATEYLTIEYEPI